jgi:protein phosphatase
MNKQIEAGYLSERGRRPDNEDIFAIPAVWQKRPAGERGVIIDPESRASFAGKGYLTLVGDGVGGREGGELASLFVGRDIPERYYNDPSLDLPTSLQRVIEAANRALRRLRQQPEMPPNMATTLAAAIIHHNQLVVAGVGDSRVYLLRGQAVHLITGDHSWAQNQLDRRLIAPAEARQSPDRHRITRCLGSHDHVGVDVWRIPLRPDDRVLLCSDGVSGYLTSAEMAALGGLPNAQQAVNGLIDRAYDNGSRDNMTAVLIKM